MNRPVLAAALACLIGSGAPAAIAAGDARLSVSGTQCRPGERVEYSCTFGASVVSVCSSGRHLAYRYGPRGKPELVIDSTGQDGKARLGSVTGGGGGFQHHLRFTNGEYNYVVFYGVQGSLHAHPGKSWSGLSVLKGEDGAELSNRDCKRSGAQQRIDGSGLDWVEEEVPSSAFDAWF